MRDTLLSEHMAITGAIKYDHDRWTGGSFLV